MKALDEGTRTAPGFPGRSGSAMRGAPGRIQNALYFCEGQK